MKKVDIVSFRESRNQQYAKDVLASWNGARHFYYIETYGCQMNVGDTEIVVSLMQREGYVYTDRIGEADVILINTCSIRDNAEQRIWGRLAEMKSLRPAPSKGRNVLTLNPNFQFLIFNS